MKNLNEYFENTGNTWIPQILAQKEGYSLNGCIKRIHRGITYYSTPLFAKMEELIADKLIDKLLESHKTYTAELIDFYIDWYQTVSGFTLASEQKEAVHMAINNTVSVLTGGPGTGKTCVLKAIAAISKELGQEQIIFCAPTGKAARRITESVGQTATTTQKCMGYSPNSNKLKQVIGDLVINDECSMMDMETLLNYLYAVSKGTHIIFVGDVEQLPSVGPGAILRDMIDSFVLPVTKLEQTFRQANDSTIFRNIQRIKKGNSNFEVAEDFQLIDTSNTSAQNTIISLYINAVKKYGADNVVCLTPYRRKGDTCSNVLNNILQDILNPIGKRPFLKAEVIESGETEKRKVVFQVGDPVMQLENRAECANGDVGKIINVGQDGVTVQYIDTTVFYPLRQLGQITLAYALSVHKSQGSEYPCVITTALPSDMEMLSRNMIYTAVTRAKKECNVVIDQNHNVIEKALEIESGYERITFLAEEISLEYKKRKLIA